MNLSHFPEVDQFFGCYFNQDWNQEFSDWRAAVNSYIAETAKENVDKVLEELPGLISIIASTDAPLKLLHKLGCYFDPASEGLTVSVWLEMLQEVLAAK